jgi:hypothetical protein
MQPRISGGEIHVTGLRLSIVKNDFLATRSNALAVSQRWNRKCGYGYQK